MSGKNIKSMQEIMLEFVVMNYKEVFARLWEGSISRKKMLPPSLFQKIIYKSREMIWYINYSHMKKLLIFRDVLSWTNIDIILYNDCTKNYTLNSKILKMMSRVEYPLKSLSTCVRNISDEFMSALCTMGSTIECLNLENYGRTCGTELLDGPFPHLRKLHITGLENKSDLYIDLSRFSDTLEELKLESEPLDCRLIRSIACLKKLKVLSLPFSDPHFFCLYNSLCALHHLRTLDMRYCIYFNTDCSQLISLICKMPNLKNFDLMLSYETREKEIFEPLKCMKLKKFGFFDFGFKRENKFQPSYNKFKSLADQVFGFFEETMWSTFETYESCSCSDVISSVMAFLPLFPQGQIARVEKIILNLDDIIKSGKILEYIKTGRCTDDFITKTLNLIASFHHKDLMTLEKSFPKVQSIGMIITSAPVARKMLEIVEKNLNKGLCRKLLEILFICSYYNLSRDIDALGLRDVCDKAHENKFLDDDAVMAMKTLLKQIEQDLIYVPQNWSSVIR